MNQNVDADNEDEDLNEVILGNGDSEEVKRCGGGRGLRCDGGWQS